MVHKQFLGCSSVSGSNPSIRWAQPFDPERHEAIQQTASPQPPGTVCQEAQRGYLRGDQLVRPAMVVVSLGPVSPAAKDVPQQSGTGDGGGGAETADNGEQ